MKYMGSKRWMLENGLGNILEQNIPHYRRFVDLFAGSGVVASYVAKRSRIPVVAYDLQEFSVVLAVPSLNVADHWRLVRSGKNGMSEPVDL